MKFKDKTLGEVVTDDFRAAQIFKTHNIDFCCSGKRGFVEACTEARLDPQGIENEILNLKHTTPAHIDYNSMTADQLIDYILTEHHQYIESESKSLAELADKVARVHGDAHPELIEVARTVHLIMNDMMVHQLKEEQVLFPYIKAASEAIKSGAEMPESCFASIADPIRAMEADHDNVGALIFKLKDLTSNFAIPKGTCSSYVVLYKRLEELQHNTFRHVHLENNILFPKALKL